MSAFPKHLIDYTENYSIMLALETFYAYVVTVARKEIEITSEEGRNTATPKAPPAKETVRILTTKGCNSKQCFAFE